MSRYLFVTGGVVSSLGKGISAASIGRILEARGLSVAMLKCDPYINVDPGTMNPFQHGEVFVTEDGAETDLDLGHYERFLNKDMHRANNVTAGQIYETVISRERRGDFLGATVQVIPHVTEEIKSRFRRAAKGSDVAIIELGGTVGDIEGLPFLEAARQMAIEAGDSKVAYVHVTLVPYIGAAQELKTKPTQHSVGKLREIGISPDMIICRSEKPLSADIKGKIALFANLPKESVFEAPDVESIYEVPLLFEEQGLGNALSRLLDLKARPAELSAWAKLIGRIKRPKRRVSIAIAGKYTDCRDAYKSVHEALVHAALHHDAALEAHYLDVTKLASGPAFDGAHGILVPGGFGERGIEGKIKAAEFARRGGVPYLGLCLGLQTAAVEFARNVLKMRGAHSTEFDSKTRYPVIHLLPEQQGVEDLGGSMRLGVYPCRLTEGSLAHKAYGTASISERHRHRYEFNNKYRSLFEEAGLRITGVYPKKNLVEILELKGHPWFVAVQFHPEFKSRPESPHPLFRDFIGAALEHARSHPGGAPERPETLYA